MSTSGRRYKRLGQVDLTGAALDGDNLVLERQNGLLSAITVAIAEALGAPADVQRFTASGTWTKPAGGKVTEIHLCSGGGGGGSGRRGAASTARSGGGGGEGGNKYSILMLTDDLPSEVSIEFTNTGDGAAPPALVNDGNTGSPGHDVAFGEIIKAIGGAGGLGGNTSNGIGGSNRTRGEFHNSIIAGSVWARQGGIGRALSTGDEGGGVAEDRQFVIPTGGGGGGGLEVSGFANAGGLGGDMGDMNDASQVGQRGLSGANASNGFAGGNTRGDKGSGYGGGGGSGGYDGGNGGFPGGGGAGGGGVEEGAGSGGSGGNGGGGIVIITTWH